MANTFSGDNGVIDSPASNPGFPSTSTPSDVNYFPGIEGTDSAVLDSVIPMPKGSSMAGSNPFNARTMALSQPETGATELGATMDPVSGKP